MAHVVSLDVLRLWTNAALKDFCRKKGLITTGRKDELVARVFAAHELSLPDVLSAEEELKLKASGYQRLLQTPGGRQPDPFCELDEGWLGESQGKSLWPPTMYCDICHYFLSLTGDINRTVTQRALNAYKEGKAFSYFDSGWLKEVYYHPVADGCDFCFVKAKCTPSQRIGDIAHSVWVMLEKKSGAIQSAYCTCFAGLGSTCNHVAAVLFKLDFFWRQGLTNKACTSRQCEWNQYGAKPPVSAVSVQDLHFRKPQFGKEHNKTNCKSMNLHKMDPFSFQELTAALGTACPDAVVFQGHKDWSPNDVVDVEVTTSPGEPLCELLSRCSDENDVAQVLGSFSTEDTFNIEKATRGQSSNELWKLHRACRVTASIAHDVSSRMHSLQDPLSRRSKDPNPILKTITKVNKTNFQKVPQLKYGKEMEPEAREQYKKIMCKKHKSLSVSEVGLVVSSEHPQYAASPDGVVSCVCCESGLLEIKCPISIAHTSPSVDNLPYFVNVGQNVCLSKKHKYYSQVQWQMGICQKRWCDFFVFTRHGYTLERVLFDEEHFTSLITNVNSFYTEFVIPSILEENKSEGEVSEVSENITPSLPPSSTRDASESVTSNFILSRLQDTPKVYKKRKTGSKSCEPVYLCGECDRECLSVNSIGDSADNSVQCDQCYQWFHFLCVSYTADNHNEWLCSGCSNDAQINQSDLVVPK